MFRRKLTALDYHNPGGFDCTGERNIADEISGPVAGDLLPPQRGAGERVGIAVAVTGAMDGL